MRILLLVLVLLISFGCNQASTEETGKPTDLGRLNLSDTIQEFKERYHLLDYGDFDVTFSIVTRPTGISNPAYYDHNKKLIVFEDLKPGYRMIRHEIAHACLLQYSDHVKRTAGYYANPRWVDEMAANVMMLGKPVHSYYPDEMGPLALPEN